MFYLMAESPWLPILSLLAFLPQLLILCKMSVSLFRNLELVFFVNTAVFVTFNKVVTSQVSWTECFVLTGGDNSTSIVLKFYDFFCFSQYFLWYLCLLPLLAPYLKISRTETVVLTLLWSGQFSCQLTLLVRPIDSK